MGGMGTLIEPSPRSGWNENYRHTFEALRLTPHETKLAIWHEGYMP